MKNGREILRVIGRNIRKERLKADLTQEGLAEVVGIHWKTLSYIESGKRDFGATIFALIVLRLKIPPGTLLEGLPYTEDAAFGIIRKAGARKRRISACEGGNRPPLHTKG